jgi:predicted Rossmann fold flavoprotein
MKRKTTQTKYDVLVVGGGASGLIAAARAAELGAKVLIVEKNESLGRKLLLTGGGRCNLTNVSGTDRQFLEKLGDGGKFLFSTFSQHGIQDSLSLFKKYGLETKVENEGRVFPSTDMASSVLTALLNYIKEGKVEVEYELSGAGIHVRDGEIVGFNTNEGTIEAKSYIIATGGASHPGTGSTGDGWKWLSRVGHTIHEPDSALVPVQIKEEWVKELNGISPQNVKITLYADDKKIESRIGRMVFTYFGVSGPLVLNFSRLIRETMADKRDVKLLLDIVPDLDYAQLDQKLQDIFAENHTKKIKNAIKDVIPPALVIPLLRRSRVNPDKELTTVSREERLRIGQTIKNLKMTPTGFLSAEDAIVASGGVDPKEIDFKTMRSRINKNLFLVGDMIDIERPSGGYSLQICWSTGWVAGTHAAGKQKKKK